MLFATNEILRAPNIQWADISDGTCEYERKTQSFLEDGNEISFRSCRSLLRYHYVRLFGTISTTDNAWSKRGVVVVSVVITVEVVKRKIADNLMRTYSATLQDKRPRCDRAAAREKWTQAGVEHY